MCVRHKKSDHIMYVLWCYCIRYCRFWNERLKGTILKDFFIILNLFRVEILSKTCIISPFTFFILFFMVNKCYVYGAVFNTNKSVHKTTVKN